MSSVGVSKGVPLGLIARSLWTRYGPTKEAAEKGRIESEDRTLSGFYETAVECKGIPLVFVLLGVFVFAVAFCNCWDGKDLEGDSSRTSIRTRSEAPKIRCLMVSDENELGLLSKARLGKAKPLSAVTKTRDGFVGNKLCSAPDEGRG